MEPVNIAMDLLVAVCHSHGERFADELSSPVLEYDIHVVLSGRQRTQLLAVRSFEVFGLAHAAEDKAAARR